MKAITIWQPWASLIAYGFKPFEFRRWAAPSGIVGHRIGIHAGARKMKDIEVRDLLARMQLDGGKGTGLRPEALEALRAMRDRPHLVPHSAIVCTVVMGTPRKASALFGADLGDSDRIDHHIWAWPMNEVERLEPPAPARGAQGFWNWSGAA